MEAHVSQAFQALRAEIALLTAEVRELKEIAYADNITAPTLLGMTPSEGKILTALMSRRICSKDALYGALYGDDCDVEIKTIDVFICKIRKKLRIHGLQIQKIPRRGWYFDPATKDAINAMMTHETDGARRMAA